MNNEQLSFYHLVKDIVHYAYIENIEIKEFIHYFFSSEEIIKISKFCDIVYYHPLSIYYKLIKEHEFKKDISNSDYDINIINYICYIYTVFHFRTSEPFKLILKILPINDILKYYEQYHTFPDEKVIFKAKIAYNLKMNNIRKNRKTGYFFDLTNQKKNLYIAKHLYLKLFNYPEINQLQYEYTDYCSFLKSSNTSLFVTNLSNIENLANNESISYINYNFPNSILFVFLSKDDNLSKKQIEDIFYMKCKSKFNSILFYKNEMIYFINRTEGFYMFNLFVTSLDIRKIEEDFANRLNIQ